MKVNGRCTRAENPFHEFFLAFLCAGYHNPFLALVRAVTLD
jgi:hypothetical protein